MSELGGVPKLRTERGVVIGITGEERGGGVLEVRSTTSDKACDFKDKPRDGSNEGHPLGAASIKPRLKTRSLGRDWRYVERTASTNDDAKAAAANAPHGTVFICDEQTNGRGRLGRSWFAPGGENLTFSLVLKPAIVPAEAPPITLAAGRAVAAAVESFGVTGVQIKWPNDVLVGGRKIAGILTEMISQADRVSAIIMGIGLNVNTTVFPESLKATSLAILLGRPLDRAQVLLYCLDRLGDTLPLPLTTE